MDDFVFNNVLDEIDLIYNNVENEYLDYIKTRQIVLYKHVDNILLTTLYCYTGLLNLMILKYHLI